MLLVVRGQLFVVPICLRTNYPFGAPGVRGTLYNAGDLNRLNVIQITYIY